MTRDSKLALVISITMILLVGVLLSDHLSGATGASFDEPEQETQRSPIVTPSDPIGQIAREQPTRAGAGSSALSQGRPIEISQGGGDGLLDQAFERFRDSDAPALVGEREAGETLDRTGLFDRVDSNTVTLPPVGERRVDTPIKPMREPERGATTTIGTEWRTHTVVAGDSLYAIARTLLGDGNRWREILENNKGLLESPSTLAIGMVLKIDRVARTTTRPSPARSNTNSSSSSERTYVVLPGDMLGTISQKLLGTARRVEEIVELNGLDDANDIKVGQTLRIPAR